MWKTGTLFKLLGDPRSLGDSGVHEVFQSGTVQLQELFPMLTSAGKAEVLTWLMCKLTHFGHPYVYLQFSLLLTLAVDPMNLPLLMFFF